MVPDNSHVDTDAGRIYDGNGAEVPVITLVVEQDGGTSIRVFVARAWTMGALEVRGARSLAMVAAETISIRGRVDASANGRVSGPGAQESPAVCVGGDARNMSETCELSCASEGAGGGGNATPGASGGAITIDAYPGGIGGALIPGFVPLVGGCRGGDYERGGIVRPGGGGGGAVQLVAGREITLSQAGIIDLGGGGGDVTAGGGSGGNLVAEAPSIRLEGAASGVVANGGAGGGCGRIGDDAHPSTSRAVAPKCDRSSAGDGATAVDSPQRGAMYCEQGQQCSWTTLFQGGGGGAAGRALFVTATGEIETLGAPLLSVALTRATLVVR